MKKFLPLLVTFICVNGLVIAFAPALQRSLINTDFILGANLILFILSAVGFFIQMRGAASANTNVFIRGVYSSLLMKLFLVVAAVLIYVVIIGGDINKRALLASLMLYVIYTSIEVVQLMKMLRNKNNG